MLDINFAPSLFLQDTSRAALPGVLLLGWAQKFQTGLKISYGQQPVFLGVWQICPSYVFSIT
jgi:hypothetical protein